MPCTISFSLFILSILVALTSAAKLPAAEHAFSDALVIFVVAIICAIAALNWLFRSQPLCAATLSESADITQINPQLLLAALVSELKQFELQVPTASQQDYVELSQRLQKSYVLPFIAQQMRLYKSLDSGLRTEVFFALAHGERLLNRMNSAASDGYLDEVRIIYPKILAAFTEAQQQARQPDDDASTPPLC